MTSMHSNLPETPVFCAVDTTDLDFAKGLAAAARAAGMGLKFGKEFFTAFGPQGVGEITENGGVPFFLDLKYHDIPNTVAGAVRAALPMRPGILNVHASGGPAMLRGAAEAAAKAGDARPLVIAVTVLTSLDGGDLDAVGIRGPVEDRVTALARLAQDRGLDGVVCAATDIAAIRAACGKDFTLVVPGIRPAGSDISDHKRSLTPSDALAAGANYLVIGRPISGADDPAAAARAIADEIAG